VTCNVAVASTALVEPWVVVKFAAGISFKYEPAAALVTLTLTVQVPLAASVPPEKLKLAAPAVADTVPPHVVEVAGVLATTTPEGRGSDVIATPVRLYAPVAVFAIVIVTVDVPPAKIELGEKALVVVNAGAVDIRFALAAAAVPALVTSEPVVFVNVPLIDDVTFTTIVHPPTGTDVPEAMVTPLLVTETLVHVPALLDDVMLTPAGIVSVNAELSVYAPAVALPRVIVSVEALAPVTVDGANDFVSVGVP
jgi:hypothetical protein